MAFTLNYSKGINNEDDFDYQQSMDHQDLDRQNIASIFEQEDNGINNNQVKGLFTVTLEDDDYNAWLSKALIIPSNKESIAATSS